MKLHLHHIWQHDSALNVSRHSTETWRNAGYAALLLAGVPAVVAATMFAVHYLYDGMMWLLPS